MDRTDLRPAFPAVLDQGNRETCLAFATTAAHELTRQNSIGQFEDLSEETYWKCKDIEANQLPGTTFGAVSDALENTGQPHEAKWPYDGLRDETDGSYIPPQEALDPKNCFTAQVRMIPVTVDEITKRLTSNQAVILGIRICDTFLVAPQGRVPMPAANLAFIGGHAVLVVGYEEDAVGGRWLIFRNSWGDGWGDRGYGYLPSEYIKTHAGEAAVANL